MFMYTFVIAEIDNWSKTRNLDNFCKTPKENWHIFPIRQVKSTRKFLHAIKAFLNFSFVRFHWKITWPLGRVNKKAEKFSSWIFFFKIGKKCPILWKNTVPVVTYGLNFLFKMQFLRVSRRKNGDFSLRRFSSSCTWLFIKVS